MKVAAYCRVSTEREDQRNSLESQRSYFTRYIMQNPDWELSRVYYDEGITGTQTRKRAGFNQMIADGMAGEFELILTKEVSRFARNTVDALSYTRKLKEHNIGVLFIIDHIDTRDSDGELRLTIMASMAQEESRKTSERVKWGQRRRMEQGVVFGRDLLGYRVEDGRLFINEEEAPIVRAIFQKYTNEGKGTHVIARELTEQNIPSKSGKVWSNVTILRILKNEKYAGDLCQKKTITPDYLSHKKVSNQGEEEMICFRNHHPAIIQRQLWEQTQEELKRRSIPRKIPARYSSRCWCSGKLLCQNCKSHYIRKIRKRKDKSTYQIWKCYSNTRCKASYKEEGKSDWGNGLEQEEKAAGSNGLVREGTPDCSNGLEQEEKAAGSNGLVREGKSGCGNGSVNELTLLACMGFVLERVLSSQGSLKSELEKEICQELQNLYSDRDFVKEKTQLSQSIEELARKKRAVIDLAVEGIITKEELKCQTEWYETRLAVCRQRLQKLAEIQNHTSKIQPEPSGGSLCEITVHQILNNQFPCPQLYGQILERIDVFPDNCLTIWLKHLPVGFRLTYTTHGRMEHYTTEITNLSLIVTRL